jgi:3-oxoadipate enol-lactonase
MDRFTEGVSPRLRYVVSGPIDGEPVLLAHSLGTRLELWDALAATLESQYCVVRYDTRGHGESDVPAGEYSIDDLGHDAISVLDAAGIADAHIVGISLGGLTGMWLGINVPSRVRSLVIANSFARVGTPGRWEERIATVRERGLGPVADMTMTGWFTSEFRERDPAAVERCRQMIATCAPAGYIGCCAALRDADLRAALSSITAPTVVVAGAHDVSAPVADVAQVAEAIPGGRLVTLPSAHMSVIEFPEEFARIVGS